ncbi:MAG: ABC transporter permease [Alphaproteobacteria bacterium]|nr:ABC transporter permease [Alphaproteobacteria bacterium]
MTAVSLEPGAAPRGTLARLVVTTPGLIVARLLIVGAILLAWELASGDLLPPFWFSSPSAIAGRLVQWLGDGTLWRHLEATLTAMIVGYGVGCAIGIATGLLLGFMPFVQRVLTPYLSGLYALPKIALAPLFIILLGIDIESKIALVAITVFFLLLYSTLDGVRDVDRDLIQALGLMGANRREIARKVLVPATMPWVFTGMRIAVRYALTAAILGEVIGANRGIGYLIEASAGQYNATGVFAAVLVLVVCCVGLTELLTRAERSTDKSRP